MKKSMMLATILLAVCVSFSFAQRNQGGKGKVDPEAMAKKRTEEMKASLDLTPDQVTKVEALNLSFAEKMSAAREEAKGDREAMQSTMKPLVKEMDEEFKAILTSEQYEKFVEQRKEARSKGGKGRGDKPHYNNQ